MVFEVTTINVLLLLTKNLIRRIGCDTNLLIQLYMLYVATFALL